MGEEFKDLILDIPKYIANLQLPDPELRNFYLDEEERIYWLDGEVNDTTLDLIRFILKCNKEDKGKNIEDRKRILIMIDSPGGSAEVLQSLIGTIKISKTPVWTCCYCTAYSAAADLLACGHKRFALPMTNIMFHAGSAAYQGTQSQVDKAKKFYDNMGKRINNEVQSRTNFDSKIIKKIKTDDVYLTEVEALTYGVIDEIVENADDVM